MKNNRLSRFAIPYVIWMALFVVAPIIMVVIYAFSASVGGFTLDISSTAQSDPWVGESPKTEFQPSDGS